MPLKPAERGNMAEEKVTLEENFEAVEESLKKMEQSDLPLEEAFKLYEDSVKRLKACAEEIDDVEKKVKALMSDGTAADFE